jgi:IclR family KDG regulon transcriptional repressor
LENLPTRWGLRSSPGEIVVSKSGIHKILKSLAEENLLVQNPSTRKYSLGPLIFRLGNVYSDSKGIWEVSHTIMDSLAKETGTAVLIGIREGDDPILAYKMGTDEKFIYQGQIGTRFPFNAGALGKLLTAFLPEDRITQHTPDQKYRKKDPYTERIPTG